MNDKITNSRIYKKLVSIEKAMKTIAKEEEFILGKEERLEREEKEEIKLLKKIHGQDIKRRFTNIWKWKRMIWDNCPDKATMKYKKVMDFMCKKTGKSCRFIDCYRNKIK